MSFDEFIGLAKAGKLVAPSGDRTGKLLTEKRTKLDTKDLEALTAEAFNQDVFSSETPWDEALNKVSQALEADWRV